MSTIWEGRNGSGKRDNSSPVDCYVGTAGSISWSIQDSTEDFPGTWYGLQGVDSDGNIYMLQKSPDSLIKINVSGEKVWAYSLASAPTAGLCLGNNAVYVVTGATLLSISFSGALNWSINPSYGAVTPSFSHMPLVDSSDNIYLAYYYYSFPTRYQIFYKVNPSGSQQWSVRYASHHFFDMAVNDNYLFYNSTQSVSGALLNTSDGSTVWTLPLETGYWERYFGYCMTDDKLYVARARKTAGYIGKVVAYNLSDASVSWSCNIGDVNFESTQWPSLDGAGNFVLPLGNSLRVIKDGTEMLDSTINVFGLITSNNCFLYVLIGYGIGIINIDTYSVVGSIDLYPGIINMALNSLAPCLNGITFLHSSGDYLSYIPGTPSVNCRLAPFLLSAETKSLITNKRILGG